MVVSKVIIIFFAGPQSRILEASFDSVDSDNQQRYVIGAASKGMISFCFRKGK